MAFGRSGKKRAMRAKAFGLAALAPVCGAGAPAEAQFMTSFPRLIVPPPAANPRTERTSAPKLEPSAFGFTHNLRS
jgi:hypothetical protein